MKYTIDDEFIGICRTIVVEGKTPDEWAETESDDMFQSTHYVGGFDHAEMAFCFSVYINQKEFWFQLDLDEIIAVNNGYLKEIEIRETES